MLSFFRTKSTEPQVSDITVATEALSMAASPSTAASTMSKEQPTLISHSDGTTLALTSTNQSIDLLKSLGYNDATELRDTVYGG